MSSRRFIPFLCLFLAVTLLILMGLGQPGQGATLDDDAALPYLPLLAALVGVFSLLGTLLVLAVSRRWPPPLRPPQPFVTC
jgi:hypothetical protein